MKLLILVLLACAGPPRIGLKENIGRSRVVVKVIDSSGNRISNFSEAMKEEYGFHPYLVTMEMPEIEIILSEKSRHALCTEQRMDLKSEVISTQLFEHHYNAEGIFKSSVHITSDIIKNNRYNSCNESEREKLEENSDLSHLENIIELNFQQNVSEEVISNLYGDLTIVAHDSHSSDTVNLEIATITSKCNETHLENDSFFIDLETKRRNDSECKYIVEVIIPENPSSSLPTSQRFQEQNKNSDTGYDFRNSTISL